MPKAKTNQAEVTKEAQKAQKTRVISQNRTELVQSTDRQYFFCYNLIHASCNASY